MTAPITPLITLVGEPGAACEGDACLPVADTENPDGSHDPADD